jgi:SAM-dependent methyltransferase
MSLDPSSRDRLTARSAELFPDNTLFHKVARVVCRAGCLPRKELFESWEVARRTRRRFRGGRVVDLACGHGLIALLMIVLDDTSKNALAIDTRLPASAAKLAAAMVETWPRLEGRIAFVEGRMEDAVLGPDDLVVSAHACGTLTDVILDRAMQASARVAVLPCCHDADLCDQGGLGGWLDAPLAIDVTRVAKLRAAGYTVTTQRIPEAITPKNRLLLAERAPTSA